MCVCVSQKRINAPSWCDRVLWRSYPHTSITNTSYGQFSSVVTVAMTTTSAPTTVAAAAL